MVSKELFMYGCDIEAFKASVKASMTYKMVGGAMCVASLLSDAQEMMAHGDSESARQTLNCAKALLFDALKDNFDLTLKLS